MYMLRQQTLLFPLESQGGIRLIVMFALPPSSWWNTCCSVEEWSPDGPRWKRERKAQWTIWVPIFIKSDTNLWLSISQYFASFFRLRWHWFVQFSCRVSLTFSAREALILRVMNNVQPSTTLPFLSSLDRMSNESKGVIIIGLT